MGTRNHVGDLVIHKPFVWPAGAAVQAAIGLDMLIQPSDFRDIYDRYHFAQIPRPVWGWAMLIVGISTLGARFAPSHPRHHRLQHDAATVCVFALTFLYATVGAIWGSVYLVTAEQISVVGPCLWGLAAFAVAVDAAQHGTSRGQ
jgi:hypothetical protein